MQFVLGKTSRVVFADSNQQVLMRGDEASGLMAIYPVLAQNATSLWRGIRLVPGQVVVHGPGTHVNHLTGKQSSSYGIYLHPQELQDIACKLLHTEQLIFPRGWSVASVNPAHFDRFNQVIKHWVTNVAAYPGIVQTIEGMRLEKELLRSLINMLFPEVNYRKDLSYSSRMQLVSKAEEFMRANLGKAIGSVDLCKELSVSGRTLRLAFHERYGHGHMAFFKVLRLNKVRDLLKQEETASVRDAANTLGFVHLGNFAADYFRHFGELPRNTWKRNDQGSR
ncbi:MAG: helix-turn-helix domain-containing protein [Planctomycetia bacterium]|nr:helix-turn-helix domain-containing protein [Planctomycetia bacterium]